eukprot:12406425-Karenia_brevis.AAC.1
MDNLPHPDYMDGQPSPPGLPEWTISNTWITWMDNLPWGPRKDNLHHLDYLNARPSLPGNDDNDGDNDDEDDGDDDDDDDYLDDEIDD